jgi:hypothetical protein
MRKYEEKMLAEFLLNALESDDGLCGSCPARETEHFHCGNGIDTPFYAGCREFLGLLPVRTRKDFDRYAHSSRFRTPCPCNIFNKEETAKFVWLALEKKGYLDD